MKESQCDKLFDKFIDSYNSSNWHPNDIRIFHEYVEYCYMNNIDCYAMIEKIKRCTFTEKIKDILIRNALDVYEYLRIKDI